jgi:hypothetical protein
MLRLSTPPAMERGELESSLAEVKLDPVENIPLLAPLLNIRLPGTGRRRWRPRNCGAGNCLRWRLK